jgi:hypothetical protein
VKYTLEEKLSGVRTKPVGSTCEGREPCPCGRGFIEPGYKVYTWGRDLSGELETLPSCKDCCLEQEADMMVELEDESLD